MTVTRVDAHRLAEERSLAYHGAVADRLLARPELLEEVKERLETTIARGGHSLPYHRRWREILARPLADIVALLVDPGEEARALRQSTPFAGLLEAGERLRIWRDVRDRLESGRGNGE